MNIQGMTLKYLLNNPSLDIYTQLKPKYFNTTFETIFRAIETYYLKHSSIPNINELQIENIRNSKISSAILAVSTIEVEDVSIDLLLQALEDEYTQAQTLKKLRNFLEEVPLLSATEIIDALSLIPIELDEEVNRSDSISTGKELSVFRKREEQIARFIELGLCRELDGYGGIARQELLILGGRRGYGKSLMCCNIAAHQYQLGNIAPYFSIEMSKEEVNDRIMSILSHTKLSEIREQTLRGPGLLKMACTQALMFTDGITKLDNFIEYENMYDYVDIFSEIHKLNLVHELIIFEDRDLKLSTVDLACTTLKTKYGDNFTVMILDYINQLRVDGIQETDKLDWKAQILVSARIKNLVRKLDVAGVSPYQVDDSGQARLAKGLLDAVDMAMVIDKTDNSLDFIVHKTRSLPISEGHKLRSYMDWNSVSLLGDIYVPEEEEEDEDS